MKHIKKYNESRYNTTKPKLKKVEDLDEEIKQIFLDITDKNPDLNLEVLHQYGSSSYTLYNRERYISILQNAFDDKDNLLNDRLYDDITANFEKSAELMLLISKELPEIRGRVKDIIGLESFDINGRSGTIRMVFDHEGQGYDNVGKVMLIGDPSKSMYY